MFSVISETVSNHVTWSQAPWCLLQTSSLLPVNLSWSNAAGPKDLFVVDAMFRFDAVTPPNCVEFRGKSNGSGFEVVRRCLSTFRRFEDHFKFLTEDSKSLWRRYFRRPVVVGIASNGRESLLKKRLVAFSACHGDRKWSSPMSFGDRKCFKSD